MSIVLATGNRRSPLAERGHDLYETPAVAVQALLRVERLPHVVWEPAAGRGAIVQVDRKPTGGALRIMLRMSANCNVYRGGYFPALPQRLIVALSAAAEDDAPPF
jgi:hypothetical protein